MKDLINKKILFIICGGISAYKSLEIIRLLKRNGAEIKTILTKTAKEFVTPLSVASLSQGKVYDDLFNVENEVEMDHIALSRWADVIIVAPVVVIPDILSKNASLKVNFSGDKIKGKLPKAATINQARVENKKVCLKLSLNSFSKLDRMNSIPIKIVTNADEIKL